MVYFKQIVFVFLSILIINSSQAQVYKYVKKGNKAVGNNKIEKARIYYTKAYDIDKSNYNANLGLGFVLAEYMGKTDEAIPYLERAYKKSPKDTLYDLPYVLAKCYHANGDYTQALTHYEKMNGKVDLEQDDKVFQLELKKRMADCRYGISHLNEAPSKDWYVINAGNKINTPMPEYVPVLNNNNELIFTSKRKDSPKEKTNDLDGKYFESMYLSKLDGGRPQSPRRYTVPDLLLKPKFRKGNESIISISPDGNTLYVFRNGKIYEVNATGTTKSDPKKLSKAINFDYYQNHAYLSKDAKTLLFTSESEHGIGGNDIYTATKDATGNWSNPKNIGKPINTELNEDSPFLTNDGKTLYFASTGHEGYGNYDIYKSELTDTTWSQPINLGKPINSPANDIFLIQHNDETNGYYASARKGGFGDMDIYKLISLKNINKECVLSNSDLVSINNTLLNEATGSVQFKATMSSSFTPIEYSWAVNNSTNDNTTNTIETTLDKNKTNHSIVSKIIAYCDTCFAPVVFCNTTTYNFPATTNTAVVEPKGNDDLPIVNIYDKELVKNYLSINSTKNLGFDLTPIHFDLNKNDIRADAKLILDKNIEVLKQHSDVAVLIYGFTDARANGDYNKKLSQARAKHVKSYLTSRGISKKQIHLVDGKGEQFLLNNCDDANTTCDETQHEQNRRVEFMLFKN